MYQVTRSKNSITYLGVAAVLCGLMTVASPSYANSGRDYYKVGVLTALSGSMIFGGQETTRGYKLWAQAVNKEGGIEVDGKRYKVKLVYADTKSNPQSSADAVQRMVSRKHVDFILGPYASSTTMSASPIIQRAKVPLITGSAESPTIWTHGFSYTYGAIPAVTLSEGQVVDSLVKQHSNVKSIGIIGVNDPFSQATAEAYKRAAKKDGLKVDMYEIVPPDADFSPLIAKLRSMKPDVVAVAGEPNNLISAVKAMQQVNYQPKGLLMYAGVATPDFQKAVGKYANYVITSTEWAPTMPFSDKLFGSAQDYSRLAQKKYGSVPTYTEAASSAAGEVFAAALAKAHLTPPLNRKDREKLNLTLQNINVKTFYGPVSFDKKGEFAHDNTALSPIVAQWINGKEALVGPEKLTTQRITYPRPESK